MRMAHIYQPVMLKELLERGGKAKIRDIAAAFLARHESQLEYYEEITKNMPGKVLGPFPDFTGKGRFASRTATGDHCESG